jgi:hypothetical protein
MRQHEVDPVSLVSGLVLLLAAGGFALSNATDVHLRWLLMLPVVLIVAGVAILAAVARRAGRAAAARATIDDDAELPGTS